MKFIECKLSELGEIVGGSTPFTKNESYYGGDIPWLTPKDLANFNGRYINLGERNITEAGYKSTSVKMLPINSVLFSSRAPIGYVAINNKNEVCTNQGFKSVIPNSKTNYMFLYYLLKYNKNKIEAMGSGTTFKEVSSTVMKNIIVNVPEAKEDQIKIGKILSKIDDKIELNTQTNDNLYNMCNAIFHNYIDKYSELIKYTKIIDIANKVVTGKTPSTKNEKFWNGDIPFITIPDMHNQFFAIDTERTISKVGAKSLIPKNSISVSCIATVGLVSISTEESQTNQQINSIVLKNNYDLYYLFEFLSEQENFMKNIAGGSTTYNINKTTFENIEVPYLPQDIVQKFHDTVCKLFDKIKLNQLENKNLEQLRDTLLPKLMNGEIDLDKIEI